MSQQQLQQNQNKWYNNYNAAHVASSSSSNAVAAAVNASTASTAIIDHSNNGGSNNNHNNNQHMHHMYGSFYGNNITGNNVGRAPLVNTNSCALGGGAGILGGASGLYDLEMRGVGINIPNSVTSVHNQHQLMSYQQPLPQQHHHLHMPTAPPPPIPHQMAQHPHFQQSTPLPPVMPCNISGPEPPLLETVDRKNYNSLQQSPVIGSQYTAHSVPSLLPPSTRAPPQQQQQQPPQQQHQTRNTEFNELRIKSEPPDEHNFKASFIDDNAPFMENYKDEQQQQQELHHQHLQHQAQPQQNSDSVAAAANAANNNEMINPKVEIKEENSTADFQQKSSLNFPRRKVQTERTDTLPPICQRCKQVFFKKQVYISHVSCSTCDIVEYDFKCSICPMSFMSLEELGKHKPLHRANKFFCHKYCGKYYDTIIDCEAHEYMHHEYETFVCNMCSCTFPTRELLYAHLPQHKFQQRFDCAICRLWFQTPHELHEHRINSPYFCGKYYIPGRGGGGVAPGATSSGNGLPPHRANFQNPMAAKASQMQRQQQQQQQQQANYKLQDCRMGVMEIPLANPFHATAATSTASNATVTSSSFMQQQQQRHGSYTPHTAQQQQQHYNSNNFFQMPHIKSEIKVEPDFYTTASATNSTDYHQQRQRQSQMNTSHNFNDYSNTNDSFTSSHNSSGFMNDYSDASLNAQQIQAANASTLDDSEEAVCCVPRCGVRKSTSSTLQFFTFPKDEKYLHQWLSNLKMLHIPASTYVDYRICSLHFPKRCINRYSLCYWAVPTFNLGHDDVANLYQNRELTNTFTTGEIARCSMPNCKSTRGESNVKFYNFPKDIKSLIKWCQNARLPVQTKEPRHFCGRHFEDRCIGKFRLKPWAVPTLNLGTPYGKIHDNPQNLFTEEKRCCLTFCRRSRSSDFNMSLYRFPRDEVLLQRWCYNLRLDPSIYRGKNHKICSAHFIKEALGLRKLSPGAVPTLNLGHNDTFNIYENELYAPPPPPPQKYYRQSSSMSMSNSADSFKNSTLFMPPETTAPTPYSNITNSAGNTPNVTESMDVCCVPDCDTKRNNNEEITLHTIPRRPEQLQKWCHNLKMEEDKMHKGLRVCSLHFEPYCIGGCMRPFAVPTLRLGHDDDNIYKNPDVIKKLNIRETCCVQICKRNRERDHANLHRFPSNPIMLQKWCDNLRRPVPDGTKMFNDAICEVHFEDRCLRNKRLEKWSVPTLKLGHNDLVHVVPTDEEITELYARPSAPNTGDEEGECCVESCKRNPQIDDVKLYRTPEDAEVLAKWAHNLQTDCEDLASLRICNLHFESHCIGKRMHAWAIPTLNLGNNIENLYENPEQHTTIYIKKERKQKWGHSDTDAYATKPTWVPRCCLPHCRKMRATDNVQLYRFPSSNPAMLRKWAHNLQVAHVGSAQRRVCSAHFVPEVLTKKCPIQNSVPTLELNTPPGYKIYQNPAKLLAPKINSQRVCVVEFCRKTRADGVKLFRFPHSTAMLRKWLHNLKTRPKGSRLHWRICSDHFEPYAYTDKRLASGAVPTLDLAHDDDDLYPNEAEAFDEENCCVPGCDVVREMPDVRLFKFPTDNEDQLWKWCNNLKMNPIDCPGIRICNKHFEPECIGTKHLFKWAIPTLALGHDDTDIELVSIPKQEERYADPLFKCCVLSCGKTRKHDEVQMNSFPKDPKLFRHWKHNLKLEHLNFNEREKYKICNAHFEEICIGKTRLHVGAIPTINLGHEDTENLYKVRPEKLQTNLFGKNRAVLDSDTSADSSEDEVEAEEEADEEEDEEEMVEEEEDEIAPEEEQNDEMLDASDSDNNNSDEADIDNDDDDEMELHEQPNDEVSIATLPTEVTEDVNSDLNLTQVKMKKPANILKCCVPSCRKSRLQHGVDLYSFPFSSNNPVLLKKWRHNVQLSLSALNQELRICNMHFHKRCFDGKEIRPWAVPTMQLGHCDPIYENPKNIPGFFLPVCALNHCRKRRTIDNDLRTYQFPKGYLLEKWCANLHLEPENCRGRICADHFEPEVRGKLKLKTGAVPTINLGHNDAIIPYNNEDIKEAEANKREWQSASKSNEQLFDEMEAVDMDNTEEMMDDDDYYDPLKFVETAVERNEDETGKVEEKLTKIIQEHTYYPFRKAEKAVNNVTPICCLKHCRKEKTPERHLSTFGFPKDHQVLLKWCDNLKIKLNDCIGRVCIEHFDPDVLGSRKLKQGAVPTINVGHNEALRYSCYGYEMPTPEQQMKQQENSDTDASSNESELDEFEQDATADESTENPSVFRLFSLKHCRKRKTCEPPDLDLPNTKPRRILRCCVQNCHKTSLESRLNRLPKQRLLCLKWTHNLQLDITSRNATTEHNYRVCNVHFESYCLQNGFILEGSIPTLRLGIAAASQKIKIYHNNSKQLLLRRGQAQSQSKKQHDVSKNPTTTKTNLMQQAILKRFDVADMYNDCSNSSIQQLQQPHMKCVKSESPKRIPKVCCIPTCNAEIQERRQLFRFPTAATEECQLQKWCVNTRQPIAKVSSLYICYRHFEMDAICKYQLRPWAVPTLELGHNDFIIQNAKHLGNFHTDDEHTTEDMQYIRSNYCAVISCFQKSSDTVRLYAYPSEMSLIRKWATNCKHRAFQASKYGLQICQMHFEPDCFEGVQEGELRAGAVPTLNLGLGEGQHVVTSEWVEVRRKTPTFRMHCIAPQCNSNNDDGTNIRIFMFPKVPETFELWCKNLKLETKLDVRQHTRLHLCKRHFEPHCFTDAERLFRGALPTLHLGHDDLDNVVHYERFDVVRHCCVPGCGKTKEDGVRLSTFPSNVELHAKWLHNLRLPETYQITVKDNVCNRHFEPQCYEYGRLMSGAMPTLHLGNDDKPEDGEEYIIHQTVKLTSYLKRYKSVPRTNSPPTTTTSTLPAVELPQFVCCFPACAQLAHPKMRQEFKVPADATIREQWCSILGCESTEAEDALKLCPLHFIYLYEITMEAEECKNISVATLEALRVEYLKAKSNGRILLITCAVPKCTSLLPRDNIKLYPLPYSHDTLEKWLHNLSLTNIENRRYLLKVCGEHFEARCTQESAVKRLKLWSIPTLNLPPLAADQKIYENPSINELDRNNLEYCCVHGCKNGRDAVNVKEDDDNTDAAATPTPVTFYSFPRRDAEVLRKWLHNTQQKARDSFGARVCARHFESYSIGKRLRNWAIPTLHLSPELTDICQNPSKMRRQYKLEQAYNDDAAAMSDESYQSGDENYPDETMDSAASHFEPIVKMELLDDEMENMENTMNSFQTNGGDDSTAAYDVALMYPQDEDDDDVDMQYNPNDTSQYAADNDETYNNADDDDDVAGMGALEVMLEVGHIEQLDTYEIKQAQILMPEHNVQESIYKSSTSKPMPNPNINARRCCIVGCTTRNTTDASIKLHKFPQAPAVLKKWMHNSQTVVDRTCPWRYRICGLHFEPGAFNGYRFRYGTMPTLRLGPNRPAQIYENEFDGAAGRSVEKSSSSSVGFGHAAAYSVPKSSYKAKKHSDDDYDYEDAPTKPLRPQPIRMRDHTGKFVKKDLLYKPQESSRDDNSNDDDAYLKQLKSGKYCQVKGCHNHLHTEGVTLHKFPQQMRLWKKWKHNTQIPIDNNFPWRFRVCCIHFHPSCLAKSRLLLGSVPTLNLGPDAPQQLYQNEFSVDRKSKLKYEPVEREFYGTEDYNVDYNNDVFNNVDDYNNDNDGVVADNSLYDNDYLLDDDNDDDDDYEPMTIEPEIQLECDDDLNTQNDYVDIDCSQDYVNDDYDDDSTADYMPTQSFKSNNGMGKCCIPGCNMQKTTPGLTFHKYPSPPEILKKWLHNTQVKVDLNYRWRYRICSLHFEPACFRGARLAAGCVPTLCLGPNAPAQLYTNHKILKRLQTEHNATTTKPFAASLPDIKPKIDYIPTTATGSSAFNRLTCSIATCQRVSGQDGVSLHRLPHDAAARAKWLIHCTVDQKMANNMYYLRICSRHFQPNCYMGVPGKRYLKQGACPTLNLPKLTGKENEFVIKQELEQQALKQQQQEEEQQKQLEQQQQAENVNITYNEIKSGYGKCSLIHCQKQKSQHGVTIYKFPKALAQQQRWSHNLRIRYDPQRPWKYLICSEHFEKECANSRKLYKWAVPTLHLGDNIPVLLYTNNQCRQLCSGITGGSSSEDNENEEKPQTSSTAANPTNSILSMRLLGDVCVKKEKETPEQIHDTSTAFWPAARPTPSMFNYKNKICCLPHCRLPRGEGIKLFRLPTNVHLIRKWEHNTGISFNESQRNTKLICSRHFPPNLIGIRRLSKSAVPTLELGPIAPANLHKNFPINIKSKNYYEKKTMENYDDMKLLDNYEEMDDEDVDIDGAGVEGEEEYDGEEAEVEHEDFNDEDSNDVDFDNQLFLDMKTDDIPPPAPNNVMNFMNPFIKQEPSDEYNNFNPQVKRMAYKQLHCCVAHCGLKRHGELKLFRVPTDASLRAKWERNLRMKFDINERNINLVCSTHFMPSFIGATRLMRGAVPTLNLPPPPSSVTNNVATTATTTSTPNATGKLNFRPLQLTSIKKEQYKLERCCVPSCQLTEADDHTRLLSFPTDKANFRIWCSALKMDERALWQKNVKICSSHFPRHCFHGFSLKSNAVPSLLIDNARCMAKNCLANGVFRFPDERNLSAKWCYNLKIAQLPKLHLFKAYVVCRNHFEPFCIQDGCRLHADAIPTLNLGHNDPNIFRMDIAASSQYGRKLAIDNYKNQSWNHPNTTRGGTKLMTDISSAAVNSKQHEAFNRAQTEINESSKEAERMDLNKPINVVTENFNNNERDLNNQTRTVTDVHNFTIVKEEPQDVENVAIDPYASWQQHSSSWYNSEDEEVLGGNS